MAWVRVDQQERSEICSIHLQEERCHFYSREMATKCSEGGISFCREVTLWAQIENLRGRSGLCGELRRILMYMEIQVSVWMLVREVCS